MYIERYIHEQPGYMPFLITGQWQAAFLNYAPAEALEAITCLDIHYHTDEVFVLLGGNAVLIGAGVPRQGAPTFQAVDMLPGVAYNIPRMVWHKIAMQPGSQVLIVENNNTHLGDFEFHHLSADELSALRKTVEEARGNTNNEP